MEPKLTIYALDNIQHGMLFLFQCSPFTLKKVLALRLLIVVLFPNPKPFFRTLRLKDFGLKFLLGFTS